MKLIGTGVGLALLADILHKASHAPWLCDEDCHWWQLLPQRGG